MGKSKIEELPTLRKVHAGEASRYVEDAPVSAIADPAPLTPTVAEVEPLRLVTLEVPLGMIDPRGYIPVRERLEAKSMTHQQSVGLLRVLRGLQDRGDRLRDGTAIKRGAQAVRWMLEQLANGS